MDAKKVMIWAAFLFYGRSAIAILHGNYNTDAYCMVLVCYLHLVMNIHVLKHQNVYFQQNNASIHTARLTRDWMRSKFLIVCNWFGCFPDLNPNENLLVVMV